MRYLLLSILLVVSINIQVSAQKSYDLGTVTVTSKR